MTHSNLTSLKKHLVWKNTHSARDTRHSFLSTGIEALDRVLGGGLPVGELAEIVGSGSSGKSGLLFSALAAAGRRGETVAYIDAFESFDPPSARRAGIDLDRLLWLRWGEASVSDRVTRALKAADVLVRSKGFSIVVLDLAPPLPREDPARWIPFQSFYRLKKVLRGNPMALLLLGCGSLSGSASSVVLRVERQEIHWHFTQDRGPGLPPLRHACLLRGISSNARLVRGKGHGRIALHSHF